MKNRKRPKILVVDDEPDARLLTALVLETAYEVVAVEDAEKAIERLEIDTFDLVVTDVRMPGKSGLDLIKYIKSQVSKKLPIIAASGQKDSGTKLQELKVLTYTVLEKPFEDEELLDAVKGALILGNKAA